MFGWIRETARQAQAQVAEREHEAAEATHGNAAALEDLHATQALGDTPKPWWATGLLDVLDAPTEGWQHGSSGLGNRSSNRAINVDSGKDQSSVTASRRRQRDGIDSDTGAGVIFHDEGVGASAAHRTTRARDADGKATDATETSGTVNLLSGAMLKHARTKDGRTTAGEVAVTEDGVALGASHERNGTKAGGKLVTGDGLAGGEVSVGKEGGLNASLSLMFGDGAWALGLQGGGKYSSLGFGLASMDDKQLAGHSAAETSWMSRMLGGATVGYGLMDGESLSASAEVSYGMLGFGLNGSTSESSSVHAHTTVENLLADLRENPEVLERLSKAAGAMDLPVDLTDLDAAKLEELAKDRPDKFRELLASQLRDRVDGAEGLEDLDLKGMRTGDGYSVQSGEGWGAGGSVTVGLEMSLGVEGQEAEQVTVAKTGDEKWSVQVTAMDSEAWEGGLGLGGLLGFATTDKETDSTELSFEVTGPEGLEALEQFQRTGLLPGAERMMEDPEELAEIEEARRTLEELEEDGAGTPLEVARLAMVREDLRDKIGAVNHRLLSGDIDLTQLSAGIPGVEYTTKRITNEQDDKESLQVLFFDLEWGSTHTKWDEQYRQGGEDTWARGSKHDESYVFDDDESTTAVLNPRDAFLTDRLGMRHEIELALFTDQSTNRRQRELLDEAGGLKDVPEALRQAWLEDGWEGDAPTSKVRMAWTADHLEVLKRATERAGSDFWGSSSDGLAGFLDKTIDAKLDPAGVLSIIDQKYFENLEYAEAAGSVLDDVLEEWEIEWDTESRLFGRPSEEVQAQLAKKQAKLLAVDGPEAFRALTENEQRLLLTSTALEAIASDRDPWKATVMAMQIEDPDLRNRHLRDLFHVIERRKPGTHAMIDFVSHLQEADYLEDVERKQLLGTLEVHIADKRVDRRTTEIAEVEGDRVDFVTEKILKDSGRIRDDELWSSDVLVQYLRDSHRETADDTVDWFQAARAQGGADLIDKVLREAEERDPAFTQELVERIRRVDPRRAGVLVDILMETRTYRERTQV